MPSYLYKKLIRPIFIINGSTHSIALGVALGLFIALTPTVGIQMLLVLLIGTLIKANRIIGVILCWISNPITFLPMYYGYYCLGAELMGIETGTFESFSQLFKGDDDIGFLAALAVVMDNFAAPLWIGSLIVALVVSIPSYPITMIVLNRHRAKRQAIKMERRARFLALQAEADAARAQKEEAERHEAKSSDAAQKIAPLLAFFLLFPAFSCSENEKNRSTRVVKDQSGSEVRVAYAAMTEKCALFIEFPELGGSGATRRHVYLRIFNFSGEPCPVPEIGSSFFLDLPSGRAPIRFLQAMDGEKPGGTLGLLAAASPEGFMPPHSWTRIHMGFDDPGAESQNVAVLMHHGGKGRKLPVHHVPERLWSSFIRNPSEEELDILAGLAAH